MNFKLMLFCAVLFLSVWISKTKHAPSGIQYQIEIPKLPDKHVASKRVAKLLIEGRKLLEKYEPKLRKYVQQHRMSGKEYEKLGGDLKRDVAVLNKKLILARKMNINSSDESLVEALLIFLHKMVQVPGQINCVIIGCESTIKTTTIATNGEYTEIPDLSQAETTGTEFEFVED